MVQGCPYWKLIDMISLTSPDVQALLMDEAACSLLRPLLASSRMAQSPVLCHPKLPLKIRTMGWLQTSSPNRLSVRANP